jgi:16S rRNA (uracil1498-N3)-methyltransferase
MARPPVANPLVFVDDLDAPVLDADDAHHLRRVLRLRDGDAVTIADGAGCWRLARFGGELAELSPVEEEPRPVPELTVAFAIVKGERPELVVQKLTELGVDRIVPFAAARSVVRWDGERRDRNHTRLQRIAREAAMQCRRARLPAVEPVSDFALVLARPGATLADLDGDAPTLDRPLVMIGPEGGWTDDERAAAPHRVCLSAQVLRAETAAIAAATLLTGLRDEVVSAGRPLRPFRSVP